MNGRQVTVRLDATYPLTVEAGDEVVQGQVLQQATTHAAGSIAPIGGRVERIEFDPGNHEMAVTISAHA
jgi:Na+-translocating ferredoxin:NAD+ oxidoreductase RnfC subunit